MALAATMRKKSSSNGLAQTGGDRIGGSPALEKEGGGREEDILPPLLPDWFWRGDGGSPILSLPLLYVCSDVGATVLVLLRQKHTRDSSLAATAFVLVQRRGAKTPSSALPLASPPPQKSFFSFLRRGVLLLPLLLPPPLVFLPDLPLPQLTTEGGGKKGAKENNKETGGTRVGGGGGARRS